VTANLNVFIVVVLFGSFRKARN